MEQVRADGVVNVTVVADNVMVTLDLHAVWCTFPSDAPDGTDFSCASGEPGDPDRDTIWHHVSRKQLAVAGSWCRW